MFEDYYFFQTVLHTIVNYMANAGIATAPGLHCPEVFLWVLYRKKKIKNELEYYSFVLLSLAIILMR